MDLHQKLHYTYICMYVVSERPRGCKQAHTLFGGKQKINKNEFMIDFSHC